MVAAFILPRGMCFLWRKTVTHTFLTADLGDLCTQIDVPTCLSEQLNANPHEEDLMM